MPDLGVSGQGLLQGSRVGANDLLDDLALLEKKEGWHRGDLVLLGNLLQLVNIHLDELGASILSGKLVHHWGDHFTRTTPGGEKVDDDQTVVLQGFLEFGGGGDSRDHCEKKKMYVAMVVNCW